MRIAVLMNLAPRKLGSLEGWLVAFCREARARGYAVDVFTREPVHAEIETALRQLGVAWSPVGPLESNPLDAIRRLAAYDVLHINMWQVRDRLTLLAYAAWPAKVLITDHSSGLSTTQPRRGRVMRILDRLSCIRLGGIVGVSDYVTRRNSHRYGLDERRSRTVYNGIDVQRFSPRRPANAPAEQVSMLTVAHLIPYKGIDVLLRAMAQMETRPRLVVCGDGPESERLKALSARLGLESRVEFVGLRDDVPALLDACDVFVHPATWAEAFGLTIAEAMANARPVVASRVGGIPELIEDRIHGRLFRPGDARSLAGILDELARSPELRIRMGNAARERVFRQFTLEGCVEGHLRWMEELAGHRPAQASEVPAALGARRSAEQARIGVAPPTGRAAALAAKGNEARLDFVPHLAKNTPPAPPKPPLGA